MEMEDTRSMIPGAIQRFRGSKRQRLANHSGTFPSADEADEHRRRHTRPPLSEVSLSTTGCVEGVVKRSRLVLFWGVTVAILLASYFGYLFTPPQFWKDYLPMLLSIFALALSFATKLEGWLAPFRPKVVLESAMLVKSTSHPSPDNSDLVLSVTIANEGSSDGVVEGYCAKIIDSHGTETYWVPIYEVDLEKLQQQPSKGYSIGKSVKGLSTRFMLGKGERVRKTSYFLQADQANYQMDYWKAGEYRLVLYIRTNQDVEGQEATDTRFGLPSNVLQLYKSEEWPAMPVPL